MQYSTIERLALLNLLYTFVSLVCWVEKLGKVTLIHGWGVLEYAYWIFLLVKKW